MVELLFIAISLGLIFICGLFVAAEFAFVTVDRARIERLAQTDRAARGVSGALRSLSTQLSGAQIGITITNLAIGFLAEPGIAELIRGPLHNLGLSGHAVTSVAVAIAITLSTILTMLFGELLPKNLALARPIATARKVQRFQRSFTAFMRYPIAFMNGTANIIVRRFNIEPQEELTSARSVEELLSVVKHSARRGTLTKDTAVPVERSIEFNERHASDVMTPRVKLVTVDAQAAVETVITAVRQSGYSRFPVVDGEIDNIVGIIHVRQAVGVAYEQRSTTAISEVMQPVTFIPSSIDLDNLIEKMRDEAIESAVTIDEFGGVDGLVTLEDLIEELVGEVKDEHDEKGVAIKRLQKNRWLVSGLLRPDEIGQEIGLVLPEDEEFETIGGLILDKLEEVPSVGDEVLVDAFDREGQAWMVKLSVVKMDGRRIDRLELTQTKVDVS